MNEEVSGRPAYREPKLIGLVAAGGTVGTLIRAALSSAFPAGDASFLWTIFLINVAGAFLLAFLTGMLPALSPSPARQRGIKLLFGTGLLGGFTTYSTFAIDVTHLAGLGQLETAALAILYAGGTVILGAVSAFAGLLLARRVTADRTRGGENA